MALLGAGCLQDPPSERLDLPSWPAFRDDGANNVLLAGCTVQGGGCHTSEDRPLVLHGVPGYRLDGAEGPTTEVEMRANYRSAAVFAAALDDPDDSWLLRKPLAPELGGMGHVGDDIRGQVFEGPDDPSYQVLRDWILTAGAP